MSEHRFTVPVGAADVAGVLHLPDDLPGPCVIACHGMGASKDSDKYLQLAREVPAAGLALARFDFRGSGESGGLPRDATIESRIADLEEVLAHLSTQPELDGRFGLLGSSLGGYVALWAASRVTAGAPVPVVTWNAPAALRELSHADPGEAGAALVAEVRRGARAEAPAGVGRLLVIQADRDEVVPPAHGRALFDRARDPKRLHVIAGADHRLSEAAHRREALEESRRWLLAHLPLAAPADRTAPTGRTR
ncbi:MAG TPA: alpha/beta fold hydrolase [Candidatus Eisenbacteria bacterium]|nr:alpha/beta fold hydrolase [Candidatus Eisenbacteria bacterium]